MKSSPQDLWRAALQRPAGRRAAFLDEACAGDPGLRRQVEALLATPTPAPSDAPTAGVSPTRPEGSLAGHFIGPYKILREIGRGGMGAVYLALRADDQFRKQVAIKLIKPGMDTGAVIRRFRNERQILAALDHSHIARLLDGGVSESGLSYFVMEYVEGLPLDAYCDTHRLLTAERLALFLAVCSAVQYAHQNLVVHRDLKPGNVLVTAGGVPKLLDFGIAKLLRPELSADPLTATATALPLMTPEYASPEQARGGPVTTASDVYSLGVLLYELLTGHRPYQVPTGSLEDIARVIGETDPEKPSAAVTRSETVRGADGVVRAELTPESVSHARADAPERLHRRLRGDLDTIVLMALRKEPGRRYASVAQFAEDIRRYLDGRPVIARQDTLGYRTGKFIRRHKAGGAAAALVALTLLGGAATTAWQARAARYQKARAERRFNDVRQLANSFIFEMHEAIEKLPGSTAAQALLVRRALEYLDSLAQEAGDDRSLQLELAAAYARLGNVQWHRYYAHLGDRPGALLSQRKALSIRAAVATAAPAHPSARRDLASSYLGTGDILVAAGDLHGGLEHYRQSMRIREALTAADPAAAAARRNLAVTYQRIGDTLGNPGFPNLGDRSGAREYYQKMQAIFEALAAGERASADDRHSLAIGYEKFGKVLAADGDWAGALDFYRKELAIFQANAAAAPTNARFRRDLAVGYGNVGDALAQRGDPDGALENYRAALQIRTELAAVDPTNAGARRDLAFIQDVIGSALAAKEDHAGALEYYRRALATFEALYAADPGSATIRGRLARTLNSLVTLLNQLGQKAQAQPYAQRLLAVQKPPAEPR